MTSALHLYAAFKGRAIVRTAVLVPCYNEATTVGKVVADFRAADPSAVVYVYDNNSTDDTAAIAAAAGAVVVRERRQGKGWVIRSMFRDIDADVYVMVDGDDTYPAAEALAMRSFIEDGSADIVNGDRLSSTYLKENTRAFHGFGNRLVRWLVNQIFSSDLHDIMTGCRIMSREFVKTFPITTGGFEIETEMTIHALDKGFLVVEAPVTYSERCEGSESKLNTFSDGFKVLGTIAELFRDYKPLMFFGLFSAILFVASLAMFLTPFDEYLKTGFVRKVPTLVVSIALGISALLSLVSGVLLDSIRNHSKQSYELALTNYREILAIRRTGEQPRD
jgi:glycosyltransferase involved in cell wall biosynthesis